MLDTHNDQPDYARTPDVPAPENNRYGKRITLADAGSPLATQALYINDKPTVATNPNRNKQHGFYFNADNCIGCHACESACSEKNDLPPHLAFRSVGYVEGGSWPDYHRLNLSMACNHCDDPVCLTGCPTRAYTKFAEYGAVLQDPDICFGCGYCTWVCPYNAPQLDPVAGHVQKCNMCVDRLEVGLKPACAAACLAGALDFGIIETRPDNRDQLEVTIPGFPDPALRAPISVSSRRARCRANSPALTPPRCAMSATNTLPVNIRSRYANRARRAHGIYASCVRARILWWCLLWCLRP